MNTLSKEAKVEAVIDKLDNVCCYICSTSRNLQKISCYIICSTCLEIIRNYQRKIAGLPTLDYDISDLCDKHLFSSCISYDEYLLNNPNSIRTNSYRKEMKRRGLL